MPAATALQTEMFSGLQVEELVESVPEPLEDNVATHCGIDRRLKKLALD